MRWSLPYSLFIIAVLIAGEVTVSAPINADSNILLEARSPISTRAMARRTHNTPQNPHHVSPLKHKRKRARPKVKAALLRPSNLGSPLRARHFKYSSKKYRGTALSRKVPTFHRTGRDGIVERKTGSSLDPGTHAGEHFKTTKLTL